MSDQSSAELLAYMKERDDRRRRNWAVGALATVIVVIVGLVIGLTVKSKIDESNEQEQRVDEITCVLQGYDPEDC